MLLVEVSSIWMEGICEAEHQTTRRPHERRTLTPHTSLTRTIWVTCLSEEFVDVVLVCVAVEDLHEVLD